MTRAREKSETVRQAKAWVNFNGEFSTSPFTEENGGIRNSFNISTISDEGIGTYKVNFETAFANDKWSMSGAGRFSDAYTLDSNSPQINLDRKVDRDLAITTTYARICTTYHFNDTINLADPPEVMLMFFGSSRTNAQNGLYQTPLGIFDQRGKGSLHSTTLTNFDQRGEGGLYQTPLAAFDQRGKGVLHSTTLTNFDQRGEGSLHSTSSTLTNFDQRGEGALHSTDADSIP